jgi:hypothetical protein
MVRRPPHGQRRTSLPKVLLQGGPVEALAFGLHGPSQRRRGCCRFDGACDEGPKRRVRCVDPMKTGEGLFAGGTRATSRRTRSAAVRVKVTPHFGVYSSRRGLELLDSPARALNTSATS